MQTWFSISFIAALTLASFAPVSAQELAREVRASPDGRHYAGWFDHDAGAPFGPMRVVVVRSVPDGYDLFSLVTMPRYTDAAWNAASTRCVVADAPDNGGPRVWLIDQLAPGESAPKELDPFATLNAAFRKADPGVRHLFRPSILSISWLSATHVRFRGYCNTGTYLITIDTTKMEQPPAIEKLSDDFLRE